jgi:hypothetical protein
MSEPRCPKCGFVMCELFDYEEAHGVTYAKPTGAYRCYKCEPIKKEELES